MKKKPEVRFFPIPKNLKEMSAEERREYATQLADHMLQQAREETGRSAGSRLKKILMVGLRSLAVLLGVLFYLVSILQIQDHFLGYGLVSIGLGTISLVMAFGSRLLNRFRGKIKKATA